MVPKVPEPITASSSKDTVPVRPGSLASNRALNFFSGGSSVAAIERSGSWDCATPVCVSGSTCVAPSRLLRRGRPGVGG